MAKKSRRRRRVFTDEFKSDAVELVHSSGKSIGQVARDLDLTETSLREWVSKTEDGQLRNAIIVDEDERQELRRLREENRVLKMERDFLKKAAAFFAKESK